MKKAYFLYVVLFLLSAQCLFSQAYQFKNYSVDNGIAQPYVYTINQDKNGYLFIGTGDGMYKYDGVAFKAFNKEDGLAENFVTASYQDNSRNLWLGHYEGSVTYYDGKKFRKPVITSKFSKSPIYSIVEDDKGYVWFATQNDGVFRISKDLEVEVFKVEFNDLNIFSLNFTKNNDLLVGTGSGLLVYTLTGPNRRPVLSSNVTGIPETKIQCIIKKNNSGSFWIGTEDQGLFLLTPGPNSKCTSTPIGKNLPVEIANVQDVYEDAQSNLWIATFGNGVIKLMISPNTLLYSEYQRLSEDNGLANKYTKTIYSDHEGNMWIGTYGSGLVEVVDNFFTFYFQSTTDKLYNVTSLSISDNIKWFGLDKGFMKVNLLTSQKWQFYTSKNGFTDDKVTALYQIDTNYLIVGTEHNGAFRMDIHKNKFEKIDLTQDVLCNSVNTMTGNNEFIWIATKSGIFKITHEGKTVTHYTTETGLTHNNINHIYLDKNNTLWISTHSNYISSISANGTIQNKKVYNGADLINITGVVKDQKGTLWIATFGNGVFKMDDKDSIMSFNAENDLKSNYCYSIIDDGAGNIWVGHRMGVSRIKSDAIKTFGKDDGITGDCNYNAFFKDANGNAWFGTTNDAIMFDPHKDKKNLTAPIVNITSLKMNDKFIDASKTISLPYDDYRLRIDFIGVSFKANSRISYQYKLEGYDADWSDKTYSNFAQYGKLVEGEYTFLLRAFNSDGVSNAVPLSIHITIAPPIWKSPWFIILIIAGIIYAFYLIVKIRESNHRRFQAQLQKALNEKTREVIIQKEEIEKKNKDITDSIRYAKRIQDAILPDLEKLKRIIPLSFVFFQPRDIVSGDFYWFEQYGNKFIIVCADATGHGVPGAFMSMIGSTLLKDITSRPDILSPAETLDVLDKEIKNLLRQNDDDLDHTHDTVDIIICEIDLETYFMRMCSTRRSMFISINNELTTFKKEKDSSDSQGYENRSIQLHKGDTLYMFTDGYPDQFGGEKSKKIKISNMKLMLEQIQTLPMNQQSMVVDRYFNRWKEGHEQVDDVLFIGLKL